MIPPNLHRLPLMEDQVTAARAVPGHQVELVIEAPGRLPRRMLISVRIAEMIAKEAQEAIRMGPHWAME